MNNIIIENASVQLKGQKIYARFRDKIERLDGLYFMGHFDGKLADMKALIKSGLKTVNVFVEGKLKATLSGVEWYDCVDWSNDSYDYAVAYLNWDSITIKS